MKVKVTLGDWSNDGHGMTEVYIVDTPTVMSEEELKEMYRLGVEVVGFDMTRKVARSFEDNSILREDYDRLVELGYKPYMFKSVLNQWDDEPEVRDDRVWLTTESYLDMYFFFVGLGYEKLIGSNDSFCYLVVSDDMPQVKIGGYGLFNC